MGKMKKLLFIGICVPLTIGMVLSACNNNQDNGKEQSVNDSPSADTATAAAPATTNYDAALALLNDISVDRATFKQLYTNCRVKSDEFNGKFLYDKTSPATPNSNALFAYINETTPGIRLVIQYYATQKLAIKTVTFTIDGETHNYHPPFKTDFGDGNHHWEYSDEPVTNAQLPMLIKLATGKQAQVKFTGAQGQQVTTLTPQQQQSLKNMLMIYKGILMGYNA